MAKSKPAKNKKAAAKPAKTRKPEPSAPAPTREALPTLEFVARLAIPVFAAIATMCVGTLVAIYISRPNVTASTARESTQQAPGGPATTDKPHYQNPVVRPNEHNRDQSSNRLDDGLSNPNTKNRQQRNIPKNNVQIAAGLPSVDTQTADTKTSVVTTNDNAAAETPSAKAASTTVSTTPNPQPTVNLASAGKVEYQLTVLDDQIKISPQGFDLGEGLPSIEKYESGFEYLHFNGENQSLFLPSVSQSRGSLIVTARMNADKSVVLISSAQDRLTIRKNTRGIRWRLGGATRQGAIRDTDVAFDDQQWHQFAVCWEDGGPAIFYVDGAEVDRFNYVHENKFFKLFKDITICRNVKDKKQFPADLYDFTVYASPMSPADVATSFDSLKSGYPDVFGK